MKSPGVDVVPVPGLVVLEVVDEMVVDAINRRCSKEINLRKRINSDYGTYYLNLCMMPLVLERTLIAPDRKWNFQGMSVRKARR